MITSMDKVRMQACSQEMQPRVADMETEITCVPADNLIFYLIERRRDETWMRDSYLQQC